MSAAGSITRRAGRRVLRLARTEGAAGQPPEGESEPCPAYRVMVPIESIGARRGDMLVVSNGKVWLQRATPMQPHELDVTIGPWVRV